MRIWHQSGAPLAGMGPYAAALDAHVRAVVSPGTEVVFHGLPPELYAGRPPAAVLKYAYARHVILSAIVENCIRAEREGFDAVAIASYNDPFIHEARSVVDIPVASMAESSLLTACALARRIALVTLTPENVIRLRELVERHALTPRVAGVYSLEPRTNEAELMQAFAAPEALIANFAHAARRAIDDGAEIVIPAEGVLNEVLFAHRCTRVQDVPVLDCVGNVFLHAEMLVNLRARTGLSAGRRWEHARPDPELFAALRRANGLDRDGH
ncbi:MAG: aspartate/glutamate racemase family protein [Gammaproteobacteria bacterium]